MNAVQVSPSGMRAFRLLVAALGVSQPGQQLLRCLSALRQQMPQHRVICGRVIWGSFLPLSRCSLNWKAPASKAMVMCCCQPNQCRN
jgi:hypothetical protein